MSSLMGILSTVILVSTVCTLIFAVGAYIVARRGRTDVNTHEASTVDIEEDPVPAADPAPAVQEAPVFRRVQGRGTAAVVEKTEEADDDYRWK
jgi:hypothetical protein